MALEELLYHPTVRSGDESSVAEGFKCFRKSNLDLEVGEVLRDSVVEGCRRRPLDGALCSHEHVVQHGSSQFLCQSIKASREDTQAHTVFLSFT